MTNCERDRNPNPPSAKRQTHFSNGSRECGHSPYSKPPYVKQFVARPGQTTNDSTVPANLQTKRRRQGAGEHKTKRKPTALRHLLRSERATMAKGHHNLRADRQATTDHSTAAPPAHGRATTRCAPRRAVLQESGARLRNRELKPTRPIKSYRLHRKAKWRE
jgi:hypothetical protein